MIPVSRTAATSLGVLERRVPPLTVEGTQVAVAAYCAVLGSLMLMAPHVFTVGIFLPVQLTLPWWGALLVGSSVAMLLATTRERSDASYRPLHLPALLALSGLAILGVVANMWPITFVYGLLGLCVLYAAWSPGVPIQGSSPSLLACLMGIIGMMNGYIQLSQPGLLRVPGLDLPAMQPLLGAANLCLGGLTLVGHLQRQRFPGVAAFAQPALALLFVGSGIAFALQNRSWSSLAFSLSFGVALGLQPWLGRRWPGASGSLRARLALAFAVVAALPLIGAQTIIADWLERSAIDDALIREGNASQSTGSALERFVSSHLAAIQSLARQPGLLSLPPDQQLQHLSAVASSFPNLANIAVVDAEGRQLVRTDGNRLVDIAPTGDRRDAFERARRSSEPLSILVRGTALGPPALALIAPIVDRAGSFQGAVVGGPSAERLASLITQSADVIGRTTYVVDQQGRVVAHPSADLVQSGADFSTRPAVQAALEAGVRGPFDAGIGAARSLAGITSVPSLGWFVITERPLRSALAVEYVEREVAYLLLWLMIGLSATAGYLLAGHITRPLRDLATAANQFGRGVDVALPTLSSRELNRLSHAFGQMRADVRARERDLRESEVRYHLLFGENPVPAWVFDRDTLRFVDVNQAAIDFYGYTFEEFMALSLRELRASTDAWQLDRGLQRTADLSTAVRMPMRHCTKDGREVDVEVSWRDITLNGRRCRLSIIHDVTDRVQAQTLERQAREQAEQALAVREEFFTIAAHELKTPITVLRGQAQLNLRRLRQAETPDGATVRSAFRTIEEQSRKLQRLVDQLLDLARLESGRLEIERSVVDLTAIATAAVESARLRAGSREIQLEAPSTLLAEVDALRIEQVLSNLIDNALKYGALDEPIEVAVQRMDEEPSTLVPTPSSIVQLTVRDHGRGIPEADRERIFLRFQQVHPNDHVKGFGLGLFVCRQIVELHGGSIHVESPRGGGSLFVVRLPALVPALSEVRE